MAKYHYGHYRTLPINAHSCINKNYTPEKKMNGQGEYPFTGLHHKVIFSRILVISHFELGNPEAFYDATP